METNTRRSPARPWLESLADLVWPPRCAACQVRIPPPRRAAEFFCEPCRETLTPVEPPACSICSEPYPAAATSSFRCPNCPESGFAFEFAVSAWMSRGALQEAIHRFNNGSHLSLRLALSHFLLDALRDERIREDAEWILVPVPLHPRRFRERQFNQSAELAGCLARRTGYPVIAALQRTRYTTTQASLTREARLRNLRGAFQLDPRALRRAGHSLTDRPVLLVDDVFTTGSTAQECADVLRRETAPSRIVVITVARG